MNSTTVAESYEVTNARIEAAYNAAEDNAFRAMTSGHDGPVTAFVVMARAVQYARNGAFPRVAGKIDDPIANALDRALEGLLREDADMRLERRHPSRGS